MDYRLPGMDGVQATAAREGGTSRDRGRLSHRFGELARDRGAVRGGRDRVPDEGPELDDIVDCRATRGRRAGMNLNAQNTAIVIDSTADFPDAQARYPNWRVVPLYVNFGTESYRDGVDLTAAQFYERLRTSPELPTTSQPTPGDFLAAYEELAALRADPLRAHRRQSLRHVPERGHGSRGARRRPRAHDRLRERVGRDGDARDGDAAPTRARHDRRGDRRARRALPARARLALHRRHARVPRARRPDRAERRRSPASFCT